MPTDFDEWPDEPDDPDPESRWGDPEDDLVSVPSVEVPGEADEEGAGVAVDGDLAKFFWATVVYANVALAGISIGLLLVGFRGQWGWGGGAVAVGLFALYRTYDLYRTYREDIAGQDGDEEDGDDGGDSGSRDEGSEDDDGARDDADGNSDGAVSRRNP